MSRVSLAIHALLYTSVSPVTIHRYMHGFVQVVFEGIRGSSYRGDMAIDDITFSGDNCACMFFSLFNHFNLLS